MEASGRTVFVCRQTELKQLEMVFDASLMGEQKIVFIKGEAGTGKTALIHAFLEDLSTKHQKIKIATVRCNADSESSGLIPFYEVIQKLYELDDAGAKQTRTNKKNLDRTLKLIQEVAPVWLDIILFNLPTAIKVTAEGLKEFFQKKDLTSSYNQTSVFSQLKLLLEEKARKEPIVIFIDDIHWIDQSSIDLLCYLQKNPIQEPVFIVCAYRPSLLLNSKQMTNTLLEIIRYGAMEFPEISAGIDLHEYLKHRFPKIRFSDEFIKMFQDRTEGYPLFVVQLFDLLAESGQISSIVDGSAGESTGFQFDNADTFAINLPESVQAVIDQRLSHLDDYLEEILKLASVEGEDFTAEVITRIQNFGELETLKALDELEQHHRLIVEKGVKTLGFYRTISLYHFAHRFIKEHIYEKLSKSIRRSLHQKVAECLEEIYSDHLGLIAHQLLAHYKKVDLPEKIIQYGMMSAKIEYEKFSWTEAIRNARLVYETVTRMDHSCYLSEMADAVIIWEKSAYRSDKLSDVVESLVYCTTKLEEAGEKDLLARTLIALGEAKFWLGAPDAEKVATRAVEIAEELGDPELIYDSKYIMKDIIEEARGQYRKAQGIILELLDLSKDMNDQLRQIDAIGMLAWSHICLGQCYEAVPECHNALALLEDSKVVNPILQNMLLRFLGLAYTGLGDFELAVSYLEKARSGYRIGGDKLLEWYCDLEIADALAGWEKMREARDILEKLLCDTQGKENDSLRIWILNDLARLLVEFNETDRAKILLEEADHLNKFVGAVDKQVEVAITWAQYFAKTGDYDQASEAAACAKLLNDQIETDVYLPSIHAEIGNIHMANGAIYEAELDYRKMLDISRGLKAKDLVGIAQRELARLYHTTEIPEFAWSYFNEAIVTFHSARMFDQAEKIMPELIHSGKKMEYILPLQRQYKTATGNFSIDCVDIRIFNDKYFADCLHCDFCYDSCCSYGVDIDTVNVRRILKYTKELEILTGTNRTQWFENDYYKDEDYPGGTYTRTQAIGGACIFLDRSKRGCYLHRFCHENDLDHHILKPMWSSLFPITFDSGLLLPSYEVRSGELMCLGEGATLYRGVREELRYYFGEDLVQELDGIEAGE
jgi:tetratricopeptide (TPR) repeat protein/AAA+ ATPase superfamily predicted ATPase